MVKREPGKPDKERAPILHWSQKLFWFSAGLSLLLTTSSFTWRVWQGKPASIEWGNVRINSQQAETLVAGAKDRLIVIRATLNDAIATGTVGLIANELDNFDDVMKSLGVAESALKKQQVTSIEDWGYTGGWTSDGWSHGPPSNSPYVDDQGFNYGGSDSPTPRPTPKQRRTAAPK